MKAKTFLAAGLIAAAVAGCSSPDSGSSAGPSKHKGLFKGFDLKSLTAAPPPVIRQPVLPELLKPCRGHVLVPALGMIFVARGANPPDEGKFMREEYLSAPYRIIPPQARISPEQNPVRLNVELDSYGRIVGLYCG